MPAAVKEIKPYFTINCPSLSMRFPLPLISASRNITARLWSAQQGHAWLNGSSAHGDRLIIGVLFFIKWCSVEHNSNFIV